MPYFWLFSVSLDRQGEDIAHSALGQNHARRAPVRLQLAPQPEDLDIYAAIEDILVNSRRLQKMFARQRPLRRFQKSQQQCILALAQGDMLLVDIKKPAAAPLQPPAAEPVATPLWI